MFCACLLCLVIIITVPCNKQVPFAEWQIYAITVSDPSEKWLEIMICGTEA